MRFETGIRMGIGLLPSQDRILHILRGTVASMLNAATICEKFMK